MLLNLISYANWLRCFQQNAHFSTIEIYSAVPTPVPFFPLATLVWNINLTIYAVSTLKYILWNSVEHMTLYNLGCNYIRYGFAGENLCNIFLQINVCNEVIDRYMHCIMQNLKQCTGFHILFSRSKHRSLNRDICVY